MTRCQEAREGKVHLTNSNIDTVLGRYTAEQDLKSWRTNLEIDPACLDNNIDTPNIQ